MYIQTDTVPSYIIPVLMLQPAACSLQPAACTTPVQVEACNEAFDQMREIEGNRGKLGGYLVIDAADDDRATEDKDEEEYVPFSEITKHLTKSKYSKARLQMINANEMIVLDQIS
jgi:hypothetical protein